MSRKDITIKAFNMLADSDDTADNEKHDFTDCVSAVALESIAINLAELTDKVCELTAYMQGFAEWAREQKESK